MKHMNSQPPRKYTFDEWAWYLALIGEDESSTETHRRALRKVKKGEKGEGLGTATEGDLDDGKGYNGEAGEEGLGGLGEKAVAQDPDFRRDQEKRKKEEDGGGGNEEGVTKWSWVGNRSPLMGNKEEAEWVLERLIKTLQRELDSMRKEELEKKGEETEDQSGDTKAEQGEKSVKEENGSSEGKEEPFGRQMDVKGDTSKSGRDEESS